MNDLELGPYLLGPNDSEERGIYQGDCRALCEALPDESVDMIFTDPPYPRAFLPLYEWLGKEAIRLLKPGGYLIAYGGAEFMAEELNYLLSGGMTYFWTHALIHTAGSPRMWYKKVWSFYKPIFILTKGKPGRLAWMSSVIYDRKDKRFHAWGQGMQFAIRVMDLLTDRDAIILDPFMGGGMTAEAAQYTGRRYLGFEVGDEPIVQSRGRMAKAQPPLPIIYEAQLPLLDEVMRLEEMAELGEDPAASS